ncbi:MAG: DoxX family protein [Rhizobiaceae bacterium]|nr:DoxX family protein [Rhizobiaceae bacterium]
MISFFQNLYCSIFGTISRLAQGWLLGLSARLVFLSVFFLYYMSSFFTKVGEGIGGFFQIQDGAYFQIVPSAVEAAGYDTSGVSFLSDLVVFAGTYTEFFLPILIVIGLLTRAAALGMIGFMAVQTIVDINYLGADEKTIGAMFDRFPDALISDQRLLWVFVMLVLVIKGAGYLSIDHLFNRKKSA